MSLQTEMVALKEVHKEEIKSSEAKNKEICDALKAKEEQVLRLQSEIESLIKAHQEETENNKSKIKEI